MKHVHAGRKLERNRNGRRALVRGLVESLVVHGRITTTEARAKEIKSRVDRLLNFAKEAGLVSDTDSSRRVAILRLLKKRVSSVTLHRLSDRDFVSRFSSRQSGYARVIKMPPRRSDGARVAVLEFVD